MSTTSGLANIKRQDGAGDSIDYSDLLATLRTTFASGKTKDLGWRRQQLQKLKDMLTEHLDEWSDALAKDLGRHKHMTIFGDLNGAVQHCASAMANLDKWSAKRKVATDFPLNLTCTAYQQPEPKGVCLNIAPWNFPLELVTTPMAQMIAAGNCVVVKPSEVSVHVSKLLDELIPQYMDPEAVVCVVGAVPETTALLAQKWDHIMYTGNGYVARIVMAAAAKHLTPVTLELGGKSPVFVDKDCNLDMAVRRILNGKTINCGQICLAPDYVLLHKDHEQAFFEKMSATIKEFYPNGQGHSDSYARIINERHWQRVADLLGDHGGEIMMGGIEEASKADKLFPTTVVKNPKLDSRLMTEEVFGPVLPVVTVNNMQEAVNHVNSRDKPLGLYIFSNSKATVDSIVQQTSSGGVTVNDVIMHVIVEELPFGGVGPSGLGAYHGKRGFDEFSHLRSVLDRGTGSMDLLKDARYPPFSEKSYQNMRNMVLWGGPVPPAVVRLVKVVGTAGTMAAVAFAAKAVMSAL